MVVVVPKLFMKDSVQVSSAAQSCPTLRPKPSMHKTNLSTMMNYEKARNNRCESWTIRKAERQRIDAFELWCWRRLLRVHWTAKRSNQFILKEISLDFSLEGLMLKLKLQYFGHLMRRTDSFEKTLMLGKIEGKRRRGRQDEMVGWHH